MAQSLAACGIPVRVSSFSSLRGYTVLRVLKGFADKTCKTSTDILLPAGTVTALPCGQQAIFCGLRPVLRRGICSSC